jgi:Tfp pilus assembly protein PilN
MRALSLDYHHTPRLAKKAGIALLVLGVVAALQLGSRYYELSEQVGLWEAKTAEIERLTQHGPGKTRRTGKRPEQLGSEMKRARETLLQLALPWDELFRAVEASDYDQVALLAIEPDPQKKLVRISGEARTVSCMLQYLRVLQEAPVLSDVYLHSHQIRQQDPDKPVHFTVQASWVTQP